MARVSFKMKLFPGKAAEYRLRHDHIWPELVSLLKSAGISSYSIFLDEETHILFALFEAEDIGKTEQLAAYPVMKRWWDYMADVMEANPDHSPVSIPLKEMFYLP